MDQKLKMQKDAGLPHPPTDLTLQYRLAVSGEGERASDWQDKPHRLVYDLCREIERIAATGDKPRFWCLRAKAIMEGAKIKGAK
jgi:hypothetical protein